MSRRPKLNPFVPAVLGLFSLQVSMAADLLMFPDLPPGVLYASGIGDPQAATITPIIGDPGGAFSGSDYYLVHTGTVLNGGRSYGGIQFNMPDNYLDMPVPQRYKFSVALASEDLTDFMVGASHQDGLGQNNALSRFDVAVGADWTLHTWYGTLDGEDLNGHPNIPRSKLFVFTADTLGGPNRLFLIDHLTLEPVRIGDFDEDDDTDCQDIDALVASIVSQTHEDKFDLTGDGLVDHDDLSEWREAVGEQLFGAGKVVLEGDSNLDGHVNGEDFIVWNQHKFMEIAAWCAGDFDASGVVNGGDFVLWNQNKFTSSDLLTTQVPEADGVALACVGLLMGLRWVGRQQSGASETRGI